MFLKDFHSFPRMLHATMLCAVFVIVPGLMDRSIETMIAQEWTELLLRDNLYSAKFRLESFVEHGFCIEYVYFK